MKISITVAEIKKMISDKLGLCSSEFEMVIENADSPELVFILNELEEARKTASTGNVIAAIKTLRENARTKQRFSYSLWEAKTVVENLDAAIAAAKRINTWPVPVPEGDGFRFARDN